MTREPKIPSDFQVGIQKTIILHAFRMIDFHMEPYRLNIQQLGNFIQIYKPPVSTDIQTHMIIKKGRNKKRTNKKRTNKKGTNKKRTNKKGTNKKRTKKKRTRKGRKSRAKRRKKFKENTKIN